MKRRVTDKVQRIFWYFLERKLIGFLGMLWTFSLFFSAIAAAEEPKPQVAPLSPHFQRFLDTPAKSKSTAKLGADTATGAMRSTGYIPSPNDYSHLKGRGAEIKRDTRIPRAYAPLQYDLRTLGRVTPVRDQGSCGACWAFGTVASAESVLLPTENWNFSENHLKNTSGFDWANCDGGNSDMATAYFSRWSGPVSEADDPYSAVSAVSPPGLVPKKHIQEVLIIPGRESALDLDGIKQALMDHGAITTSFYVDNGARSSSYSDYYNPGTHAYYYNGSADSNHIVAIVGWDDTYSASNFSTRPPGNGAFIVKNSWGTSWGNSGYFYISYYDTVAGQANYLFKSATDTNLYSNIYQYDPLGKTRSLGYADTTGWFANIFTATKSENLAAVSFHTNDINATYEVYIYKGVSDGEPRSGIMAATFSGTIPYPGYHTLAIPNPVPLMTGERFSVVVRVTNPMYRYPIPVEAWIYGYTSQATISSGQSFMSPTGISWGDLTDTSSYGNVALKAFTAASPIPVTNGVCGASNGGAFTAAPTVSLCSSGTASTVMGGGPWSWTCNGTNGGGTASCSASLKRWTINVGYNGSGTLVCTSQVNNGATASCTVTPASGYLLAAFTDNSVDKKEAVINGAYTIANVTTDHDIAATFSPIPYSPDYGACGNSNGGTFTAPPTASLCAAGFASSVTGTGPWIWTCSGSNGQSPVTCSTAITISNAFPPAPVPKTGQTACYNGDGLMINCSGTGQDAELQAGAPWSGARFVDNGDRTMTDRLTGLIWSKDARPGGTAFTWQGALDSIKFLNSQNYLGHNDWRLPNINEMKSLINSGESAPGSWLQSKGFYNVGGGYWSSSTAASTNTGRIIFANDGSISTELKHYGVYSGVYNGHQLSYIAAWPVRSGQPGVLALPRTGQAFCYNSGTMYSPEITLPGAIIDCSGTGQDGELRNGVAWPNPGFADNGDQTVTDSLTGLVWSSNANPAATGKTWSDALNYINTLNSTGYLGYNDWRLPNRSELETLWDSRQIDMLAWLNTHGFSNVSTGQYWSSTNDSARGWGVDIGSGVSNGNNKQTILPVWPVRAGQYWSLDSLLVSAAPKFGSVPLGTSPLTRQIAISNRGSSPVAVSPMAISGPNASEFSLISGGSSPCGSLAPILAPGASCTLILTFSPASSGAKTASIDIVSAGATTGIPLSGTAIATIYGKVTDQATGLGVSGATVTLNTSATTTTGPDGSYTFGNLAAATYSISVSKTGYQTTTKNGLTITAAASTKADVVLPTAGTLAITTPTVPSGTAGQAYVARVMVAGGTAPYTFSVVSGNLPAGLTLDPVTGGISGTPSGNGSSAFTVRVSDSAAASIGKQFIIDLVPALQITTATLPGGIHGADYSAVIHASGGMSPYTYKVTSGSLADTSLAPDDLILDSQTGVISGSIGSVRNRTFTVTVTDAGGRSNSKPFTISIDEPPVLVWSFTIPATSRNPVIPISTFEATATTSGGSVTGYCITETSSSAGCQWSGSKPLDYTCATGGSKTLHAWAKDAAGNVSAARSARVTITLLNGEIDSPTLPPIGTGGWSRNSLGDLGWFSQTTITHDGHSALQSGVIPDSASSWFETTLTGPGTLSFWWKVSSHPDKAYLDFDILNIIQQATRISGETDWQQQAFQIPPGDHRVRWTYYKDENAGTSGADAGWVDEISWVPGPIVPVVTAFTIPAMVTSTTIPVTTFTATDNIGVTGYLITEVNYPYKPSASAAGWSSSAPVSFTVSSGGRKTLYAWVKDADGYVSECKTADVVVSVPMTVTATAGDNGSISPAIQTVDYGSTTSFTVTPANGYKINNIEGCNGSRSGTTYTTGAITEACTVTATFARIIITTSASGNGTISPSTLQTVDTGATTSFTVTPDNGSQIYRVTGCDGSLSGNTYTTGPIYDSCEIRVYFAPLYVVTPAVVDSHGTISPAAPQSVNTGATLSFTLTPDRGYRIAYVYGYGCDGTLSGNTFTTNPITGSCQINAVFWLLPPTDTISWTISFNSNGGSAVSSLSVFHGSFATRPDAPTKPGYTFAGWYSDSALTTPFAFEYGISADATLYAKWTATSTFTVTPSAGSNGSISPATPQTVNSGASTSFTVTPNSGYQITSVTGCNGSLSGSTYTTGAITGACTVTASFSAISSGTILKGDVNNDNKIDIMDALLTLQYALNLIPHNSTNDPVYQTACDVAPLDTGMKPKGDGKVDVMDALVILQRAVNLLSW